MWLLLPGLSPPPWNALSMRTRHGGSHQGTPIPWSPRHNAMNFMRMVGPPRLEPDDVGYVSLPVTLGRTP